MRKMWFWMVLAAWLPARGEDVDLVILHLNDSHGRLTTPSETSYPVSRIARYVKATRKRYPGGVLFLHAGDELSRGNALTRATKGRASFELFDRMGLDAFTVGNGEFYSGSSNLLELAAAVRFPVLHANSKPVGAGETWLPATAFFERRGVRIGIVGGGRAGNGPSIPLRHRFFNDVLPELLPELTGKADFTIALTHQGVLRDIELAQTFDGIDVVVGGDSHTLLPVPMPVSRVVGGATNVTWVAQAGEYGKYLGRIDVTLTRPDKNTRFKVASLKGGVVRLHDNMPEDPELDAVVDAMHAEFAKPQKNQ